MDKNQLYYGDNLDVMKKYIKDESVDLVYLDPPFNSKRNYSVIFGRSSPTRDNTAQIEAFQDTWHWTHTTEQQYIEFVAHGPGRAVDALAAFRSLLGENDAMAYLVNMAPRLVELHRVLKPTGSVYLHCDQTMAHYLKIIMDAVFGTENFLNNVVWLYGLGGSSARYWPRKHDDILWYSKSPDQQHFIADRMPAKSAMMAGMDKKVPDYWDIPSLNNMAKERLGYPTQKPLALLERIIRSSCPVDGIVLDPFCGCGTSVDAAHRLGRPWIGIDITYIAVDLIIKRLIHTYGKNVTESFELKGIPRDLAGAQALFKRSPFDFERWAVSMINAEPNAKQVGDKGVDGVARFPLDAKGKLGRVLVSVKGGKTVLPTFVRDLHGTVNAQSAQMGVLITMVPASRGVHDAIEHGGVFTHPANGQQFPRLQHVTIPDLLAGERPRMPATVLPYIAADKLKAAPEADGLF